MNRIHDKLCKSNAGAKSIDVVLMFKLLVLQQLHNLSDDRIEYQIRDRLSFMRFLGLQFESRVLMPKQSGCFVNALKNLFDRFHEQLTTQGCIAQAGQMINAIFVEAPRQRNKREENTQIKSGETPKDWQKEDAKPMLRQKDLDTRWTKKNNGHFY